MSGNPRKMHWLFHVLSFSQPYARSSISAYSADILGKNRKQFLNKGFSAWVCWYRSKITSLKIPKKKPCNIRGGADPPPRKVSFWTNWPILIKFGTNGPHIYRNRLALSVFGISSPFPSEGGGRVPHPKVFFELIDRFL